MRARRVFPLVVGVLALTAACSTSHTTAAAPATGKQPSASPTRIALTGPLLTATTLSSADVQLHRLLTATLVPGTRVKGNFIGAGVDLLPAADDPACPVQGQARDDVDVSLMGTYGSPDFGPAAEASLEKKGWSFGPWTAGDAGEPKDLHAVARSNGFQITVDYIKGSDQMNVIGWTPCLPGKPNADKTTFPFPQPSVSAG